MARTQDDTRCKGVKWFSFCAVTSAPFSIKNGKILESHEDDARCKGVE